MARQTSRETKIDGVKDQVRGNAKQGVGDALGDTALERQGEREERQGALKRAWGNIRDAFKSN